MTELSATREMRRRALGESCVIRSAVARQVRSLLEDGAVGGLSDGELLERFATRAGDAAESAFAALVERHGPMVLRACRSILRDPHDVPGRLPVDVPAPGPAGRFALGPRLAGPLAALGRLPGLEPDRGRPRLVDGPWNAGRPVELPRSVRRAAARRPRPGPPRGGRAAPGSAPGALVLCYLEGLTHEQAAEHLACPVGTVRSRLARGRERLRRGLARRGFAPPTSADEVAAPLVVPAPLATLAIQAAATGLRPGSRSAWSPGG